MKSRTNAKQKRETDARKRKEFWSPKREAPAETVPAAPPKPEFIRAADLPQQSPEEETREFLAYLERYKGPVRKDGDDAPRPAGRKTPSGAGTARLNLEEGMPLVEEAVRRMRIGLQEMKAGRVKTVKLIHGYGSTGRGGKIRDGVRKELADMKRRNLIRDFIPGEEFGPLDAASRKLAEQDRNIPRDPDYGRMNHGITIVVL